MLLSIREIASWQIPTIQVANARVRAELPALQRGAVWRAPQMEALWDSVLRGFPVGAFLLAPFDSDRGTKTFAYATERATTAPATHHLLDGQQRSNALALGFVDPWALPSSSPTPAVLWVDLEPPGASDEREFVFRVLTRAHPWGYRYNSLAGEGPRLTADTIRAAVRAYTSANPALRGKLAGDFELKDVWPWDAHAPVPFCFLVAAVESGGDVWKHVQRRLSGLPFWNNELLNINGQTWKQRVLEILEMKSGAAQLHRDRIIDGVRSILDQKPHGYRIPGLMLPTIESARPDADVERQDPVETLFIRVNAGGTRLDGEELVYSILKSIWPEAEQCIADMDTRIAQPARIVILASRLVLAKEKAFTERPPAAPDVQRFRRLINGADRDSKRFRSKLLKLFEDGSAGKIFGVARDLLTKNKWCPLPTVLAADVARQTPDIMFLLLRWVQKMLDEGQDPLSLREEPTLRTLGAITALSWFSENASHCLTTLWHDLQNAEGRRLCWFLFKNLEACYRLTNGKLGLLPLVPPKVLASVISANILECRGFGTPASGLWYRWNWEYIAVPTTDKKLGNRLHPWYHRHFAQMWARPADDDADGAEAAAKVELDGIYQQAWTQFINRLWGEKRLLLFAQREWMRRWFPRYDPTSPDQIDESDRPWDFDHIHPSAHIERRKNVPRMVREWHGSMGNLRAWPLQANRGDGDKTPRRKLSSCQNLKDFGILSVDELLDASFVGEELDDWNASSPENESSLAGYLGKPSEFGNCRQSLLRAILMRFLRIYRTWYETLLLGS